MVTEKQVMAFIQLTPFAKERMAQNDPDRYKELKKEMERLFPLEGNESGEVTSK
jgi:hypothetical protein